MAEKSRIVNVLATKCDRTEIRKTRLRVRMLKMVRIARMLKMVSLARMIQMVRLVSARGARIANRNRIRIMLLVETGSCHPSSGLYEARIRDEVRIKVCMTYVRSICQAG